MKFAYLGLIVTIIAVTYLGFDSNNQNLQHIPEFFDWKINFNKIYDSKQEQAYRLNIFIQNLKKIELHNSQPLKTYEVGLNQFSDLTQEQFVAKHLTLLPQTPALRVQQVKESIKDDDRQINWVEKGYVTSIKDQGACGACWAFAALGPLEAQIKLQGGPLVSLSAQQLMDCSTSYGNYGCSGGYMTSAYKYIKDKGVTTEDKYPYKGAYQKCITGGGEYKVKGFVEIQDCRNLANQLMSLPVAVAVDATKFYNYKGGIFTCNDKPMLNHAFPLVGMTKDYWLAKEQWGVKWGQNGYIRIAKTGTACGICMMASYPV